MSGTKPTSVAASVAKLEAEDKAAAAAADKKAAKQDIPGEMVLVRLQKPAYDSRGVYHSGEDPTLMLPGDVPTTATILKLGDDVTEGDLPESFLNARMREKELAVARDRSAKELRAKREKLAKDLKDEDE